MKTFKEDVDIVQLLTIQKFILLEAVSCSTKKDS